jgi:hypothetical protein
MKIDLKALRQNREQRMLKIKQSFESGGYKEVLQIGNLAKGSSIWAPPADKPSEFEMRILQFQVTQPNNVDGDAVGDFATYRSYMVHSGVGASRQPFICPHTFGGKCPVCDYYYSLSQEERKSKESYKFRARNQVIFNALLKVPGNDGKVGYKVVVYRGGQYGTIDQITAKLAREVRFIRERKDLSKEDIARKVDEMYLYSDLELGFWLQIRNEKAAIIVGGKSSGVAFPHFVEVIPFHKNKREPVTEQIIDRITDLDLLIPKAPSLEELNRMMGNAGSDSDVIAGEAHEEILMASEPVSTEPEEVPESEVEEEINGSQGDSVTVDNAVTLGDNFSDNAGGAGDDVPPFEQEEKPAVKPAKTKPAKKEEKKPEVDDVDDFGDFV